MWIADSAQIKETRDMIYTPTRQAFPKERVAGNAVAPRTDETLIREGKDGATVAISAEGMGLAKKNQDEEASTAQEAVERQIYQEMLERANEAAQTQGEGFGDLAKALEIARRILNGDIVPRQDEQFLMEFNSEIYMRVKSMAKLKEDPKEYDTLMEEEEDGDKNGNALPNAAGSGDGLSIAAPAGAETSGDGAEA